MKGNLILALLSLFFFFGITSCKKKDLEDPSLQTGDTGGVDSGDPCYTGDPFGGGSGTEPSPYLICTAEQLKRVGTSGYSNKVFQLQNDLDLKGKDTAISVFNGIFDGNGKTLSHFESKAPLFGLSSGTIKNLTLDQALIVNSAIRTGALVGTNEPSGKVIDCSVDAVIESYNQVGGIAGTNRGEIIRSHARVSMDAVGFLGGIAGTNNGGKIQESSAEGSIRGTGNNVGGLVGSHSSKGVILNSYARTDVAGVDLVGGLAGEVSSQAAIQNAYSIGLVTAVSRMGGLIGDTSQGTVVRSYWDMETSGIGTSSGGEGKTTLEMGDTATYVDWDFFLIWRLTAGYPELRE